MDQLATYDQAAVMEDMPRHAMDKRLYTNFYVRPVMNNFKSAEAGRPIFDEVDYVRIIIPGDKNNVVDTKVTEEHKARFEKQFERFKKNQEQAVSGTPLEVWPQMTVGQVAELKAMNIHTVEQLAEVPDNLAQKIMDSHALRAKAKLFLEAAAGEAVTTKMSAELEKRDVELAALKEQLAQVLKNQAAAAKPAAK